jgi:hypothetical protein
MRLFSASTGRDKFKMSASIFERNFNLILYSNLPCFDVRHIYLCGCFISQGNVLLISNIGKNFLVLCKQPLCDINVGWHNFVTFHNINGQTNVS